MCLHVKLHPCERKARPPAACTNGAVCKRSRLPFTWPPTLGCQGGKVGDQRQTLPITRGTQGPATLGDSSGAAPTWREGAHGGLCQEASLNMRPTQRVAVGHQGHCFQGPVLPKASCRVGPGPAWHLHAPLPPFSRGPKCPTHHQLRREAPQRSHQAASG